MRHLGSLRSRLVLLVLMAALPAFGVIVHTSMEQRRLAVEQTKRDALWFARLAALEQRQLVAATHELLLNLADRADIRRPKSETCHRTLSRLLAQRPHYTNFGVAMPNGDVVCSARRANHRINIADRSYFHAALTNRSFSMSDYQIGRITNRSALNFGYPVIDPTGRVAAVVYAALDLSWLTQLISRLDLPKGAVIKIVDNHKTVLARYPALEGVIGERASESGLIDTIGGSVSEGTTESVGMDGVARLYAFAPLNITPNNRVYVSFGVPTSVALAEANSAFARSIMFLITATLLAVVAAWIGGHRLVVRRAQALIDAVRRLQAGDHDARSMLPHEDSEIGALAGAFDEMAEALEARRMELVRVNRALKTLSAGNRTLVRSENEAVLLQDMCRAISEAGAYPGVWVIYRDEEAPGGVRVMASVGADAGLLQELLESSYAPVQECLRTERPYLVRHSGTVSPEACRCFGLCGWGPALALPLRIEGTVCGALITCGGSDYAFAEEEVSLLLESAEDLAFGIGMQRARVRHNEANDMIRQMAYYDSLTGLASPTQFEVVLRQALEEGARGRRAAVLLINLNRFRDINDALGFEQGNRLLKEVGPRIRAAVPEASVIARMRGDEFGVLVSLEDQADPADSSQRISKAFESPFTLGAVVLDVQCTIGIALFPAHGHEPGDLIRRADIAARQAKRAGVEHAFYVPEGEEPTPKRLALAGALRRAIDNGDLLLYFQPKIDARTGRVCGAEALARWQHADYGLVPPADFIGLAEHTGLIKPLTYWVLESALRQCAAWRRAGRVLPLAANLSARNLRDSKLLDWIKTACAAHAAQPNWLQIELTESALMEDPVWALDVLARLHDSGVALFVDDFGTGYSSLSYLKKLPVDAIKIDKSFVMDMATDTDSAVIVQSTIDLAHDLGLQVVAEGVESQQIYDLLVAIGCDTLQGYHIGRPLPIDAFEEWLREHDPGRDSAATQGSRLAR